MSEPFPSLAALKRERDQDLGGLVAERDPCWRDVQTESMRVTLGLKYSRTATQTLAAKVWRVWWKRVKMAHIQAAATRYKNVPRKSLTRS